MDSPGDSQTVKQAIVGPYSVLICFPQRQGKFSRSRFSSRSDTVQHDTQGILGEILQHFSVKNHVIPQCLPFMNRAWSRILSLGFSSWCTPHDALFAAVLTAQHVCVQIPALFVNWKQEAVRFGWGFSAVLVWFGFFGKIGSQLRTQVYILTRLKRNWIIWTGGILYKSHIADLVCFKQILMEYSRALSPG